MFKHVFEVEQPPRMFEKGDIKYIILDMINNKPRHGYEIIREFEDRFHGFYSPSAGSIYPALQVLEEMGHTNSEERDGKKVYTITEAGKQFLAEREEVLQKIKSHIKDWWGGEDRGELHNVFHQLRDIVHLLRRIARHIDAGRVTRIKDIVDKARRDIEAILGEVQ